MRSILPFAMLLTATAMAQTTTYSEQCDAHNNSSAVNGGFDLASGNAATWNISKVPIRKLLYPNATTKIDAHFLPWSCMPGQVDPDGVKRCNGHVVTGYNSNDATTVRNQINDLISSGVDGVIVGYYRTELEDQTTMKVRDEAGRHPNFEFAVMEDKENYKSAPSPEARAQKIVADVAYINATYFSSPAYMRRSGRPVLFVFEDDSAVNWASVRAGVRSLGDPLLIFKNDFDHAEGDGAFAWIDVCGDPIAALNAFYARAQAHPGSLVWGAAFPGFDDRLAIWGSSRMVDRRRGQTWLDTFASARNSYSSSNELSNLQVISHGDYDEASAMESGIDNGASIGGAINGTMLSWSINGGTEGTIYSFRIFTSPFPHLEQLTLRADVLAGGAHSLDLGSLPGGDYEVFVQAQGQPSIRNHTSHVGHFTGGTGPPVSRSPRTHPVRALRPLDISTPANCAAVSSPIHVIACKNTAVRPASMQLYLDGKLTVERLNVDCLDEQIIASPGAHEIAASSDRGFPKLATVMVTVSGPPVTISAPANGGTVLSPVRVIADDNTPAVATSMQIYRDGALYAERFNVDHLDELVSTGIGQHSIEVKAWYGAGPPNQASVSVLVAAAAITISSPPNGATVDSPIRVIAHENTPAAATSMQIYLDGTLFVERFNVEHIDEKVPAGGGMHQIAVKAWYCDGSNVLATVDVTVTAPVTITSPANGSTVSSPIHVLACETTPAMTTSLQIYLDGLLVRERFNVECLDELVPAAPGNHQLGVKAWYGDGTNKETLITVTVL